MKIHWLLAGLFAVVLLSACGFQLRGDYQLAEKLGRTNLQLADEYSDFSRKIRRSLQRAGVELTGPDEADSILQVSRSEFSREVLSIGNDGRVREYRLRLELEFSVLAASKPVEGGTDEAGDDTQSADPGAEKVVTRMPVQKLYQSRDLRFDEGRVLATSREVEFLQQEMSDTLVLQFMQRLGELEPLE